MTQHMIDCTVIVFAKAPDAGKAKTRLIPALGAGGAAAFQARLVRHALRTAATARAMRLELWCAPSLDHPFFAQCARDFDVALFRQEGADLGARMAQAMAHAVDRGPAVLIGTDCPALNARHLRLARDALREYDAVIAPAEDGGYVLIGLKHFDAEVFAGIDWGTDSVMAETRQRLAALGWRWGELPTLWDVDRPDDLPRLERDYPALLAANETILPA
jgi:rSAM/selenodomain-associated transferase 1